MFNPKHAKDMKGVMRYALSGHLHPFKSVASFYPMILASFLTGDGTLLTTSQKF
jgi:hypothetical protein